MARSKYVIGVSSSGGRVASRMRSVFSGKLTSRRVSAAIATGHRPRISPPAAAETPARSSARRDNLPSDRVSSMAARLPLEREEVQHRSDAIRLLQAPQRAERGIRLRRAEEVGREVTELRVDVVVRHGIPDVA